MNKKIIIERKKLADKTGIDIEKYLTEEVMSKAADDLEACTDFIFTLIIPIAILNVVFIASAIGLANLYNSTLLGVLFFISSLIISIAGGGLVGLKYALSDLINGINGLIIYSFGIAKEICIFKESGSKNSTYSVPDVFKLVIYGVTLPVIETFLVRRLFILGSLLYWFVEKAVFNITNLLTMAIEKAFKQKAAVPESYDPNNTVTSVDTTAKGSRTVSILTSVSKMVDGFSKTALEGVLVTCNILAVLSVIAGIIPIVILLIIFKYI
ncbi:MAG: hypothetical protein N3B21_00935 [Clostridia bacterium]|nr:hypothetical protein [Clostridia bacterium]